MRRISHPPCSILRSLNMKGKDAAKTLHDTWPSKVMTVREVSAYLHVHPSTHSTGC